MKVIFGLLSAGLLLMAIGVAVIGFAGCIAYALWLLISLILDWLYDLL